MADDSSASGGFAEVTTRGWGGRIGGSFVGALFGIVLVIASVFLLYWNEGRAVAALRALDRAGRQVVEVAAGAVDPRSDGGLVHLTGMIETGAPARDPALGVGGDRLLRLRRRVEMFQWKEEKSSRTEKSLGGSEQTITTYSYRKEWSEQPVDSSRFRAADAHQNPEMPIRSATIEAGDVRLGAYRVDPGLLSQLAAFAPLAPQNAPAGYQKVGDTLYKAADPGRPAIGDIRIDYSAVPAQTISVVAASASGVLAPFRGAGGYSVALADPGVVSAVDMLRQKKHQEGVLTWILRGVGFVLMLIGFVLVGGPLAALAGVVPFLESLVGAGVFLIALTLAVPLTLVTIAIAWFAHRPLVGGGLILVAVAVAFAMHRLRRRPVAAAR